jgi:hypothetical protein
MKRKPTKITREAIGRECTIRLDGCLTGPCCLCHIRQIDISGGGLKAPDILGAWGCLNCHEKVDVSERGNIETQYRFREAVAITQNTLIKEGKITW